VAAHIDSPVAVLVGPESCGKTTLAQYLSATLGLPCVPEMARSYLLEPTRRGRAYRPEDLLSIAQLQLSAEIEALALSQGRGVVADTDLTVIKIWWLEKFGQPPDEFDALCREERCRTRVYLLCYPDLAWQADPLRENPTDRRRLFRRYVEVLERDGRPYRVIWGHGRHRERLALDYCKTFLHE